MDAKYLGMTAVALIIFGLVLELGMPILQGLKNAQTPGNIDYNITTKGIETLQTTALISEIAGIVILVSVGVMWFLNRFA